MLVFSMNSPSSSPSRQRDASPYGPRAHREESPQTSQLRKQVASTMLSAIPPTSPPVPKRPKLSLQTSLPSTLAHQHRPSFVNESIDSPTTRNTHANAFDAPPPTPSSAIQPKVDLPPVHSPSATLPSLTHNQGHHSPFPHDERYVLPIGTHSILRNSPLQKRHLSATMNRAPKRMFPPVKKVAFSERPVELAPTPVLDEAEENIETIILLTEEQRKERRNAIQEEDGHSTPGQKTRKKRRDWIWRPMEDDAFVDYRGDSKPFINAREGDENAPI